MPSIACAPLLASREADALVYEPFQAASVFQNPLGKHDVVSLDVPVWEILQVPDTSLFQKTIDSRGGKLQRDTKSPTGNENVAIHVSSDGSEAALKAHVVSPAQSGSSSSKNVGNSVPVIGLQDSTPLRMRVLLRLDVALEPAVKQELLPAGLRALSHALRDIAAERIATHRI